MAVAIHSTTPAAVTSDTAVSGSTTQTRSFSISGAPGIPSNGWVEGTPVAASAMRRGVTL